MSVDRIPKDLPRYPEETAVINAIAAGGFQVDRIGESKFEDHIFGERKRARVFFNNYSKPFRVDVLFLDAPPGDVRVCPLPFYEYSVVIDKRAVTVSATSELFFGVSNHFFVMASPHGVHEALIARLGLTVPSC